MTLRTYYGIFQLYATLRIGVSKEPDVERFQIDVTKREVLRGLFGAEQGAKLTFAYGIQPRRSPGAPSDAPLTYVYDRSATVEVETSKLSSSRKIRRLTGRLVTTNQRVEISVYSNAATLAIM